MKKSINRKLLPTEVDTVIVKLGLRVARARRDRRLTQAELAEQMKVSINTVLNLEKGRPSVAFGRFVMALWVLERMDLLDAITLPDV